MNVVRYTSQGLCYTVYRGSLYQGFNACNYRCTCSCYEIEGSCRGSRVCIRRGPKLTTWTLVKRNTLQCSPYQTVTSKIYHLKQHFLPPLTSWRFTKKNNLWSNLILKRKWINLWKNYQSIHSFSFYGPCILERECWCQSKIIGIKRVKLVSKDNNGPFA